MIGLVQRIESDPNKDSALTQAWIGADELNSITVETYSKAIAFLLCIALESRMQVTLELSGGTLVAQASVGQTLAPKSSNLRSLGDGNFTGKIDGMMARVEDSEKPDQLPYTFYLRGNKVYTSSDATASLLASAFRRGLPVKLTFSQAFVITKVWLPPQ